MKYVGSTGVTPLMGKCSTENPYSLLREARGGDTVLHKVMTKYVKKIFCNFNQSRVNPNNTKTLAKKSSKH